MKIRLLRGVEFWAIPRSNKTIDISWGRPGLKMKKTKYIDCFTTRNIISLSSTGLRMALNKKIPQVDIAKEIKEEKQYFFEKLKDFEVKND